MIDFWIFPLSTIWGVYQSNGFQCFFHITLLNIPHSAYISET